MTRPMFREMAIKMTPLHCAAYYGRLDMFRYLVEKGLDIEARTVAHNSFSIYPTTIIGILAGVARVATSTIPLMRDAPTYLEGPAFSILELLRSYSQTCAHIAAKQRHNEIIEELYRMGKVDLLKKKDNNGRTIAHYANAELLKWLSEKEELAHMLTEHDLNGNTPLHISYISDFSLGRYSLHNTQEERNLVVAFYREKGLENLRNAAGRTYEEEHRLQFEIYKREVESTRRRRHFMGASTN